MTTYDFIEIGPDCSEIEKADEQTVGLTITPLPYHTTDIISKVNCHQQQAIVMEKKSEKIDIHYISPDLIKKHDLSALVRLSETDMIIELKQLDLDPNECIKSILSETVKLADLFRSHKVNSVKYLKLSTFHDLDIMMSYHKLIKESSELKASTIDFRSNGDSRRLTKILMLFFPLGYQLKSSADITIIELPRHLIKHPIEKKKTVSFKDQDEIIVPKSNPERATWTLVSTFYNLDKYQDLTKSNTRSSSFYHDKTTIFSFNVPLVFFCDPSMEEFFKRKAEGREAPTMIVPVPFEDYFTFPLIEELKRNRLGKSEYVNNRNTPAYAALVMAKIEMMNRSAELNPFGSRMMGWIDYAYERFSTYEELSNQLAEIVSYSPSIFPPDRYMMGLIDWVNQRGLYDENRFYGRGFITTTFSGGFHFGPVGVINRVYQLMKAKTIETIRNGYGHGEEQIFFYTFLQHRELFDIYLTDYGQDVFNILNPRRKLDVVYRFLLPHLLSCKENGIARLVVDKLYKSEELGLIVLNSGQKQLCKQIIFSIGK
jgi:hypothetical protein